MSPPVQHSLPGMPHLSPSQQRMLDQEMEELLLKEAVHQVPTHAPLNEGFISSMFIVPKKDGGKSPSYKFKAPKSISGLRTFQNGGNPYVERSSETRRLSCKDRSQGCIPDCSNLEESPKIPTISMERNTARVCLPPVWVGHSPQGIHKTNETSSSCPKTSGHSSSDILRRHIDLGRIASLGITPCSVNIELIRGPRIFIQPQKIPVSPLSKNRIFRFSNHPNSPTPRGETSQNSKDMSKPFRKDRDFCSRIIKIPGPPNILHSGHLSSFPSLQASSTVEKQYHDLTTVIRSPIDIRHSSQRGGPVVERPPSRVEWQSAIPTTSRPNNRNGCISKGLGGYCEGVSTGGPWCSGEKRLHINCLELLAGSFAIKTFIQALRIIYPDLSYRKALEVTSLPSLSQRRDELCRSYFIKMTDSTHKLHYLLPDKRSNSLKNNDNFTYIRSYTNRFKNSYIPSSVVSFNTYNNS